MNRRILLAIVTTLAITLFGPFLATAAFAQGGTGTAGSGQFLGINGNWSSLNPGGSATYSFQYAGDKSQITIFAFASPSDGITFSVWTPQEWQDRGAGNSVNPVGRGTPTIRGQQGDLAWTGSFNTPGTYFVTVDQVGSVQSNYALNITGSGVNNVTASNAIAQQSGGQTAAGTGSQAGGVPPFTGLPSSVLPVTGPASASGNGMSGTQNLALGGSAIYSFDYPGDKSQVAVYLTSTPTNGATFSVWTPQQWQDLGTGAKVDPIGRGTLDSQLTDTLSWTGSFTFAGTYYIMVNQAGTQASTYQLQIVGGSVSNITGNGFASAGQLSQLTGGATNSGTAAGTTGASTQSVLPTTGTMGSELSLNPGQSTFFSFQYAGDKSQVTIYANASPTTGITFSVWTPQEWMNRATDASTTPVGKGTPTITGQEGDLTWSGNFNTPGTYYVTVDQVGAGQSNFMLFIEGSGVSKVTQGK